MRIDFTKMHGLGNDFLVLDLPADAPLPTPAQWRALSDRHTGVGFDQALVLQPARRAGTDAFFRVFNADGGEVELSGNGARCVAALLHQRGRNGGDTLTIDSTCGLLRARVLEHDRVMVELGVPNFDPKSLPFETPQHSTSYTLSVGAERIEIGAVSIGNPHAVLRVPQIESAPVERIGSALQADARFPRQVNVGFMQVLDAARIALRVYERGVGETLACGSGACAAVAVGRQREWLASDVEVRVRGGVLSVHWDGPGHTIWLTGPAQQAFEGHVEV